MLRMTTPVRQLVRAYGAVISVPDLLRQLAASSDRLEKLGLELQSDVKTLNTSISALQVNQVEQSEPPPVHQAVIDYELFNRAGLRLLLDPKSLVDRVMIETGAWEPEQTAFLSKLIRQQLRFGPITFLDLGSYWGLYSLLAMQAGVLTIHAFDADRHNFAQLQAQIFLNSASGIIHPHFKAVSKSRGTVHFRDSRFVPDHNRGGAGIVNKSPLQKSFEIDCVSIDDYLALRNEFLIVKMDLEGHEASALKGMRETFRRNKVILQVEIYGQHAEEARPIIEELGLRLFHKIDVDHYFANFATDELSTH